MQRKSRHTKKFKNNGMFFKLYYTNTTAVVIKQYNSCYTLMQRSCNKLIQRLYLQQTRNNTYYYTRNNTRDNTNKIIQSEGNKQMDEITRYKIQRGLQSRYDTTASSNTAIDRYIEYKMRARKQLNMEDITKAIEEAVVDAIEKAFKK